MRIVAFGFGVLAVLATMMFEGGTYLLVIGGLLLGFLWVLKIYLEVESEDPANDTTMSDLRRDEPQRLSPEDFKKAWVGFEKQANENFEVSKDIQERDGVDRKGRKVKKGKK